MATISHIACKMCGSEQVKPAYREEWRGLEYAGFYCGACELYATLGHVADISPQYNSMTDDDLTPDHVDLLSSLAHRGNAFRQWKEIMVRQRGTLAGSLLDIGCGVGGFLNFAAELGVDCHGFDAAAPQAKYARRSHPNVVRATTMEEYLPTLPSGARFRYLTMWDVLEHIPAPLPMLRSLHQVMDSQSLLYVSVPSGGLIPVKKAYHRLTGGQLSLCPWEHVFYYTPKSLRAVLERAGMEVLEIGGVATYERPMSAREAFRRIVTKGLRRTRYALQLYAVARQA